MNIKELKALLNKYPEDLKVVVDGYEDGYDGIRQENIKEIFVTLDNNHASWAGEYNIEDPLSQGKTVEKVLVLGRHS